MADTEINNYIAKRYARWLDYAIYHCGLVGIADEANDVLNEVLCSLLTKNSEYLLRMLHSRKNGYTELDFFVLKMIKLNVTSPTSPYQSKYKQFPTDENVDYTELDIEDITDDIQDRSGDILCKMHQVRRAFEELDLSPLAKRVFKYRFFDGGNFSEWEGEETQKQLYEVYNKVLSLIKNKLSGNSLF